MKYDLKVGDNLFIRNKEMEKILNHLELCKTTLPCSVHSVNGNEKSYFGTVEEVIQLIQEDFPNLWSITKWLRETETLDNPSKVC